MSPELRFSRQTLHRRPCITELEVLPEQQAIALDRAGPGEAGLEAIDDAAAEVRHQVAGLEQPLVAATFRSDLRDAGRKAAVFSRERIREHLDRLDGAARQLEIEIARRGIVQAGAAHLQRAGGGRAAFDAQPSVGTANDRRKHREQRLKVVAGKRLDVHLRAGEQIADRHGLQALGRRVRRQDRPRRSRARRSERISIRTCSVVPLCTSKGADSPSANPSRVACTT